VASASIAHLIEAAPLGYAARVEAATTPALEGRPERSASSFAKSLFMGEIHEDLVFPWPAPDPAEQERIRELNAAAREIGAGMDHREVEERRWIGDDVVRDLGAAGLCGLYVDERYGGQGLSQTGYARVFETFAQIDATLSIVMGVHQSIGFKGIHMFGTDEQKERYLPDLAAGRRLAGFALTEPEAGSDAYGIRSRAVRQPDGSWVLNGEKRYIGNGSKGHVFTAFARCEVDGEDRHIALILESGMKGFEVGERFDTMGLRGNDLRRLRFNDVRVPAENVLGEPGDGFRIAMQILNNGRIGLGTGSVGATKRLLDLTIDHVKERRQFGRPLAEFELVQEKIAWMVSYLFGLESMCYLTCGLVDGGVEDYSLESAICKVSGTEFLWYAANRAMQLKGGAGYMRDEPYEKVLRDIRIFPIFEGANDVMRAFVALAGMKPVGEKLSELGEIGLGDPIGSIGVLADYVGGRIQRQVRPDRISMAHEELKGQADSVSDQVRELRSASESLLGEHRKGIVERQFQQKRITAAVSDILAQIAVLSRVTSIFEHQGVEPSGQERYIAETFCSRAAERVRSSFRQLEDNDDERMSAIAKLACKRGAYGYALFED
jgi:acyl-CoA dehydrogenase family member 9